MQSQEGNAQPSEDSHKFNQLRKVILIMHVILWQVFVLMRPVDVSVAVNLGQDVNGGDVEEAASRNEEDDTHPEHEIVLIRIGSIKLCQKEVSEDTCDWS